MKKIPEPENITAIKLKPAEMNKIHFGGNHTPLTPDRLNSLTPPHAESIIDCTIRRNSSRLGK